MGDAEVFLRHVLHRPEQPLRGILFHLEVGDRAAALAPVAREAARDVALDAHARRVGDDEQPARVVLRVGLEELDAQRLDGLEASEQKQGKEDVST